MTLYIDVEQLSLSCWRWQIIDDSQINNLDADPDSVVISSGYCQSEEIAEQEAEEELDYIIQSIEM